MPSPRRPGPAKLATARSLSPRSIKRSASGPANAIKKPSKAPSLKFVVSQELNMNVRFVPRIAPRAIGLGLLLAVGAAGMAYADAAAPVPNKGDTAWMLTSSALVLMMSIPGLALFYGGLVRTKNMLSVLTQVFAIVSLVGVIWVLYGYSEAFTSGGALNDFVGGFSKSFLKGVDVTTTAATFSNGVVIPEYAYMVFQMTFAMITPALIVGAFAERIKFSAVMLFVLLWVTLIYFPIAHMVWYLSAPDD